jgi:hypothetical protein
MQPLLPPRVRASLALVLTHVAAVATLATAQAPPPPLHHAPINEPLHQVTAQPLPALHYAAAQKAWQFNQQQMQHLKVLQQQTGNQAVIIGGGAKVAALPQKDLLNLKQNQYVKIAVPPQSREVDGRMRYEMGARYVGFDKSGTTVVELVPVLEVAQKAMRLADDGMSYTANLLVGLDDQATPGTTSQLSDSTILQLLIDRATPDRPAVRITHTGLTYEPVELKSHAPGDSIEVTLLFHGDKVSTVIRVERPGITVSGLDTNLPGLGIGGAAVTLQLSEDAGRHLREVTLKFVPGRVDSDIVHISASHAATVHVRTKGLGVAKFIASATGLNTNTQPVTLTFPTAFFLAALIGGGLGSLCARLTRTNKSRRALVRHFVAGVIVGLIGAGLYLLGVNITGMPLEIMDNEIAVALVAALVSIGGIQLLSRTSKEFAASLEPSKDA